MKYDHVVRKFTCILLMLSLLFSMGMVAFAANESAGEADSLNFESNQVLTDGEDGDPDTYTIDIDAALCGEVLTEAVTTPLDVAIVFDRSCSMSFPADDSEIMTFSSYDALEKFLSTLNTDLWEGYYRAMNLSQGARFYTVTDSIAERYVSWEALRYNKEKSQWETFVTQYNNSSYDGTRYDESPHGILINTSHGYSGYYGEWMSMEDAFRTFQNRKRVNSYTNNSAIQFSIAIPQLTKAQIALEQFIYELNATADSLPTGQYHTVSVTGYGRIVFKNGSYDENRPNVTYNVSDLGKYDMRCTSPSIRLSGERATADEKREFDNLINGVIKSQYVHSSSRTDLAMQSLQDKAYLPDKSEGRQRVVLVLTDGNPTSGMEFEQSVADRAIVAARNLKDDGVLIYTISSSKYLNPGNGYYGYSSTNSEEEKARDFLHLLSSNYPNASDMTTPGSQGELKYWIADPTAVGQIVTSLTEDTAQGTTTLEVPIGDGESISVYEELSPNFMIDATRDAQAYVREYLGNGNYGEKRYINSTNLKSDIDTYESYLNVYDLLWDYNVSKENGDTVSAVGINWVDAKNAAIREISYEIADSAYPEYKKGYKIGLELPVKVNRSNTPGGNDLPLNTDLSGLYLSRIEDIPAYRKFIAGLVTYPILKTNVEKSLDVQIGHSLNLASDISVNYAVTAQWMEDFDSGYMEVTFSRGTFILEPEIRGDYCYFTLDGITAVDMTEELTACLHVFKGAEEFISESDVYSVADYAYAQLEKANASDELKAVCANLLRYGAQAQAYKGSENVLADAAMTAEQKAYLTDLNTVSAVSAAKALGDVENGIAWVGKSLVLDSKVAVKAVFDLKNYAGDPETLSLRVSYTNGKGEEVNLVVDGAELYSSKYGYYAFTVDSLLATDMRSELSMALYEGETQVSETHVYSVETYCARSTGALAELGKTLLAYSDAAKAYFVNE